MSIVIWAQMLMLLLQSFCSANSSSNNNMIILPLSPKRELTNNKNNPSEILKRHAVASLSRAQHHHHAKHRFINAKVPLSPRSYGEYTIPLSFGTPPQTLRFNMDTGSSLTWFPCTLRQEYKCSNCDFPGVDPAHYPVFTPNKSSSSKIVPCRSTQCRWLFPDPHCSENRTSCGYIYGYGIGNTTGLLINETLALGRSVVVDNFTVGCSVSSADLQEGIAGFGRDPESLPRQMGLTSFSHCMVSHDLDDINATSDLVMTTARSSDKGGGGAEFNYTPFLNTLDYYVKLQSISVGGVHVKVPDEHVVPNATGYGGTVIDSGTTYTLLNKPVFDLVFKQFQRQVGNKYKRVKRAENQTGLMPCYRVPAAAAGIKLPQLTFNFKGGVEMVLPLSNYFLYADKKRSVLCMTIMYLEDELGLAPAIILGNYLQQDYYIKYDLENERLGIRQQKCK